MKQKASQLMPHIQDVSRVKPNGIKATIGLVQLRNRSRLKTGFAGATSYRANREGSSRGR